MTTIDALLPVRNSLPYLDVVVDNLQSQTVKDWRASILDHGSSDGSVELVAAHASRDPRFVVASCPQPGGLSELLNHSPGRASAPFIARHDFDASRSSIASNGASTIYKQILTAAPRSHRAPAQPFGGLKCVLHGSGLDKDHQVMRELAYRYIFSTRAYWRMSWRIMRFGLTHGFDRNAMNPAIPWLIRGIKGGKRLRLNQEETLTR